MSDMLYQSTLTMHLCKKKSCWFEKKALSNEILSKPKGGNRSRITYAKFQVYL